MRNLYFLSLILALIGFKALAQDLFALKDRFETSLVEAMRQNLKPIINPDRVSIVIETEVKSNFGKPKRSSETVVLGKLGMTTVQTGSPADEGLKDISKNIAKVRVNLLLPDDLDPKRVIAIKETVEKVIKSRGEFVYEVTVDQSPTFSEFQWKEVLHWFGSSMWPIVLLIAFFFMLRTGVNIARKNQAIENKKIEIMSQQATQSRMPEYTPEPAAPEVEKFESHRANLPGEDGAGIKQFRSLTAKSPQRASELIRRMLRAGAGDSLAALYVLGQNLGVEHLEKVLQVLSDDEKKEWRAIITENSVPAGVDRGDSEILKQVVNLVMAESGSNDELYQLLSNLSVQECADAAAKNIEYGIVLANNLPASHVARMMTHLEPEIFQSMLDHSHDYDESTALKLAKEMHAFIEKNRTRLKKQSNPFLAKTQDIIRELNPEREKLFFDSLIGSQSWEALEQAALRSFPVFLMSRLPKELFRQVLTAMSVTERSEAVLVSSDDPAFQTYLVDCFGASGRLSELMELQIQQDRSDEGRMSRIERNRDKIRRQFVNRARAVMTANDQYQAPIEKIVAQWLQELKSQAGRKPNAA